jgi:hypothetical protein
MGDSPVKTMDEPTAWIVAHGQFAVQDVDNEATTAVEVSGVPS